MEWNKVQWTIYSTVGSTSKIYYGTGQGKEIIKKEYRNEFLYAGSGSRNIVFNNEVSILSRLSGKLHFPTLIHVDYPLQIIYMTHCGSEMYQGNTPKNYIAQLNNILDSLETHGIDYKDFKSQHLRCKQGILSLVDFGASIISPKKYRRMISKKDILYFSH
jgi:tRNA A-37 threonylcarbamoyl transferase component Bud32